MFSSPFIEERLYLDISQPTILLSLLSSRPLLSRSGCISIKSEINYNHKKVLVPFYRGAVVFHNPFYPCLSCGFRSRPLLSRGGCIYKGYITRVKNIVVLVPFYRGAVVFKHVEKIMVHEYLCSRPLLSRSGCISQVAMNQFGCIVSSRPLLSRSGCI